MATIRPPRVRPASPRPGVPRSGALRFLPTSRSLTTGSVTATSSLTRLRLIASVLGSAGILALAFLLGISPQLAARSTASAQQDAVDTANDRLRAELEVLRAQFARIDTTRTTLAELRRSIPDTTGVPDFLDQVAATAAAHAVTLTGYTAEEPLLPAASAPVALPVDPSAADPITAEPTPDQAAPTDPTASTDTATTPTVLDPVSLPVPVPGAIPAELSAGNFYALPLSLTLSGGTDDVRAVIDELQSGTRLFLVTTASISPGAAADQSTADLSGFLYIVTGPVPTAQGDAATTTAVAQ